MFLRSCVVEYGYFPGPSALDPHFSKSNDTRRTGLKGDFWIPRIDTGELVQQLSDNNHGITKVTYHDVDFLPSPCLLQADGSPATATKTNPLLPAG